MTRPRDWPNNARVARDEVADGLQQILINVRKLIHAHDHPDVVLIHAALILDYAQNSLRHLEQVWAPTAAAPTHNIIKKR